MVASAVLTDVASPSIVSNARPIARLPVVTPVGSISAAMTRRSIGGTGG
jgi:hypothetical protein